MGVLPSTRAVRGILGVLLLAACGGDPPPAPAGPRPSFVLVIADDQDPTHLGFLGHPLAPTPALDTLAAGGVVFAHGYTQPRCRPALAGLLTGREPHQHGVYYNNGPGRLATPQTLPALLRDAGYATFAQGKFWEGDAADLGFTHGPGKDEDFVRRDQDALFRFLEEVGEQPFFVWYAPRLPHLPHDPPRRFQRDLRPQDVVVPEWVPAAQRREYRRLEVQSHAMERWLDTGVREMLDQLEAQGLRERTCVIFLIDNGWANGLPSKGTPYERGVRTPLVFQGPGIPEGRASDALAREVDVMPTILDLAGVPVPEDCAGRSLRPVWEGRAESVRDTVFGTVFSGFASGPEPVPEQDLVALYAREGDLKYVRYVQDVAEERSLEYFRVLHVLCPFPARQRGAEELYDLAADPDERSDLAGDPAYAEVRQRLRQAALEWWRDTGGGDLDLGGP